MLGSGAAAQANCRTAACCRGQQPGSASEGRWAGAPAAAAARDRTCRVEVPSQRAAQLLGPLGAGAQLQRGVPLLVVGLDLDHLQRTGGGRAAKSARGGVSTLAPGCGYRHAGNRQCFEWQQAMRGVRCASAGQHMHMQLGRCKQCRAARLHLAVVHPQHGERHTHAPSVPLLCHAHFDRHQAGAPRGAAAADALLQRCCCCNAAAAARLLLRQCRLSIAALPRRGERLPWASSPHRQARCRALLEPPARSGGSHAIHQARKPPQAAPHTVLGNPSAMHVAAGDWRSPGFGLGWRVVWRCGSRGS